MKVRLKFEHHSSTLSQWFIRRVQGPEKFDVRIILFPLKKRVQAHLVQSNWFQRETKSCQERSRIELFLVVNSPVL